MSRQPFDFYATPAWATAHLLQHVQLVGRVLEPCSCCGASRKPGCVVKATETGVLFVGPRHQLTEVDHAFPYRAGTMHS